MCKHEEKYCPRCRQAFECKVGSIMLCQCSKIVLSENEQDFIRESYKDCLCLDCMSRLREAYHHESVTVQGKDTLSGQKE